MVAAALVEGIYNAYGLKNPYAAYHIFNTIVMAHSP